MAGGVLDAQVQVARENTASDPDDYGVIPVSGFRGYEATADIGSAQRAALQSTGMRPGLQTVRVDRRRNYIKGGEGSIELNPLTTGLGMLLRAAIGTSAINQIPTTDAYLQRFSTDAKAANESVCVLQGRPPANPATAPIPWTYTGGVIHEAAFEQEVGDDDSGQLKTTFSMDYRNELSFGQVDDLNPGGGIALQTPIYPASDFVYGWPDLLVTVGDVPVGDTKSFSLTLSHQHKRDRYYMRRSTFKKQPIRTGLPEYTGSLAFDYEDDDIYSLVQSSEVMPLVAEWRHPDPDAIDTGQTYFLRITAQVQFSGSTPQVSMDDMPNQPIDYMCLHDGSNPAVLVEYQSTDTAF